MTDCDPVTCENGKCRATGECIDHPWFYSDITKINFRNDVIEEIARMLETSYPDNNNTNAFCAAIRSMKEKEI